MQTKKKSARDGEENMLLIVAIAIGWGDMFSLSGNYCSYWLLQLLFSSSTFLQVQQQVEITGGNSTYSLVG
jgi:hypothetical protein